MPDEFKRSVTETTTTEADTQPVGSSGLMSISFLGLLLTQLLTAVNDNVFRWLVIGIGKDYVDASNVGVVLTAGTICFVAPYLLLAAPAGFLADRFSKSRVIFFCKVAEILIMLLGIGAILSGSLWFLFVVVALMGAQSALFSPSKLGSIPEILRPDKISAANGLFGLSTVTATVIGMAVGGSLKDATGLRGLENVWISAMVLIGIAIIGTLSSLIIRRLPVADPRRAIPWDAPLQTLRDLRTLAASRAMFRVALGIVFFWSVGALAQLNIDQFTWESGGLKESHRTPFLISLVLGVGIGSILAGIGSRGRVELGLLPLGAGGIVLCSTLLFTVQGAIIQPDAAVTFSFVWACFLLFGLGTSAGMFDVPLAAFMQHRSPLESRGAILAATNFIVFAGVIVAAMLFAVLRWPMYEGSLANIPDAVKGEPLAASAQSDVSAVVDRFRQAWQQEDALIEDFLPYVSPNQQPAALTQMLWIEMKSRRERGEKLVKDDYDQRFENDPQLVKAVFDQATDLPLLTSRQIFFVVGCSTIPVFVYIIWLIPQTSIRFLVWLASLTIYRIRIFGRANLPERGGALLVANHVSWLDGVLLLLTSSRPIRFVAWSGNFTSPLLEKMAALWGVILMRGGPKSIHRALTTARQALLDGELVGIFPEGGITRSGQIQAFKPGMMKILEGTEVPAIPVYLDELWGSIFSYERGKFFWKIPQRIPYPISIHFGTPIESPEDVHQVRRAVQELGAAAVHERSERITNLPSALIRRCKQRKFTAKIADSTGTELSGASFLARCLVLRRLLRRGVLDDNEQYVGLLLPPSIGGVAANMALALDRRIAVNLNYTVSSEVLNTCLELCGIKHVLTSRKFMEKMNFDLKTELVYLEDFRDDPAKGPTRLDKLISAWQAYVIPAAVLQRHLALHEIDRHDVLTIIFTSGSTGTPKGVMLTHANVAHNVQAIEQVIHLSPQDVLVGILPFFHSLGYTVTLWGSMGLEIKGCYHFSPLDGKQVGKLCEKNGGTLLLATPTFLRTYLRRCTKEEFRTLDVVVAGAEKLPNELCDSFEEKFGIRPVEGYGTTELSPLVSVNIPPSRSGDNFQSACKQGTVGRPVPGVSAKITDLDTGEELGAGKSGMLWIKGPNVMKGYLHRQDLTDEVIQDGWYKTGDVAQIDEEGFIHITGRISRFSKIGGEMVPHIKIEDILKAVIGAGEDEEPKIAVTAVPDPKKGERLIVLHTQIDQTPEQLRQALTDAGLPNIFVPAADSFHQVESLPLLGSGKIDLKGIKQIALDQFGKSD